MHFCHFFLLFLLLLFVRESYVYFSWQASTDTNQIQLIHVRVRFSDLCEQKFRQKTTENYAGW